MITSNNTEVNDRMVSNYINTLVNRFYKILPIKESGEDTLKRYLEGLQREMIGLRDLITLIHDDDRYLTLLTIIQYFIDHDTDVATVRTDVFKAISILKKLQKKYCVSEG